MNSIITLRNRLADAEAELEDIYTMSEQAACECYNVDYKEDIIIAFQELIDELIRQIDVAQEEEDIRRASETPQPYHYAFATEREFWQYKGY